MTRGVLIRRVCAEPIQMQDQPAEYDQGRQCERQADQDVAPGQRGDRSQLECEPDHAE
ncbi:hypothetical protein [Nocardia suismassiliense]|uniref:hypothetical protein n=1 Tax=Nocardia suismassiliense TaxID=2077092 RepID=UPI00131F1C88|nr:hypothetical protein [Nocardia suismassiliense]